MPDETSHEAAREDELEVTSLRSRRTWRDWWAAGRDLTPGQRLWRAVSALAAIVIVLAAITGASTALYQRARLAALPPGPTPTATLAPGDNLIWLIPDVPWTVIMLDGHLTQPALPASGRPILLARGEHVLQWYAPPFVTRRCVLSVPPDLDQTCNVLDALHSQPPVRTVRLFESMTTLLPDQQANLQAALARALNRFSTTIQPGETYWTSHGIQTAAEPVRATLTATLNLSFSGAAHLWLDGRDCYSICTVPAVSRSALPDAPAGAWIALAATRLAWSYARLDGTSIAANQPISAGGAAVADHLVPLAIAWDGASWHVTVLTGPAAGPPIHTSDAFALDDMGCAAAPDFVDIAKQVTGVTVARYVSGPNPAEGCLMLPSGSAGRATTGGLPPGACLVRFGQLVVLSGQAKTAIPVRLADASERALAARLAAYPGQQPQTGS